LIKVFTGICRLFRPTPTPAPASDPCDAVICPAGTQCDRNTGLCRPFRPSPTPGPASDPCDGVICPAGTQCDRNTGLCRDFRPSPPYDRCSGVVCPSGMSCDVNTAHLHGQFKVCANHFDRCQMIRRIDVREFSALRELSAIETPVNADHSDQLIPSNALQTLTTANVRHLARRRAQAAALAAVSDAFQRVSVKADMCKQALRTQPVFHCLSATCTKLIVAPHCDVPQTWFVWKVTVTLGNAPQ
ncbi:hypothetical protein OESDEN_00025, partial [Oesophagostomum dentatum]